MLENVRFNHFHFVTHSVGHTVLALLCVLAAFDVAIAQYELEIDSFNPSVGWAAATGDAKSGTLIKITGKNFDPASANNEVLFSGAPGSKPVQASVKASNPSGSNYAYETAFGSPGSALGELKGVGPIAFDPDNGDRYVVNIFNRRIEVFDKAGKPVRQLGATSVHVPRGIAVDQKGNVYVSGEFKTPAADGVGVFEKSANFALKRFIGKGVLKRAGDLGIDDRGYLYVLDYRAGPAVPKLFLFDAAGQVEFSFSDPFWGAHLRIAVDPSVDAKSSSHLFYISDRHNKAVYKYDTFVPLLDKWKFPKASTVGRVAVDWEGTVYVDLGDAGIAKLDKSGKPTSTVIPSLNLANPPLRTIDKDKQIYLTETFGSNACECVKVYTQPRNAELWVRVPAGAKTGPITVKRRYSWGQQVSDTSKDSFVVLDGLPAPSVAKLEVTQGLGSYPFITNKDTLVWAKLNGIFGHPVSDWAKLQVTTPTKKVFEQSADHYTYDFSNKKTYVHYHLPAAKVDATGKYAFKVTLGRSSQWKHAWSDTKSFHNTKGLNLLFVKYTDVQNKQWSVKDPAPWFDTRTFLYGIDTFSRTFPIPTNGTNAHFATMQYKDYIPGGVTDSELQKIGNDVKALSDLFKKKSLFKPAMP
ncbi:MAG: SBBP repeat-containing protein [Gammaproteobacteria bacterium]|nr:SBBP repeat-containing protein [Gammaproteobacteria bacterium]